MLHSPLLPAAIRSVALGMLAFLCGYGLPVLCRPVPAAPQLWGSTTNRPLPPPAADRPATGLDLVGLGLVVGGVALWFAVVFGVGLTVLTHGYQQFLNETAGTPLPYAYLATGLGAGMLGGAGSARVRTAGLIAFAVFALPAFVIGLRGEVILPVLAWLVTAARRRRVRLRLWAAPALVAALTAGSLVRQVRQAGLGSAQADALRVNPLDGLAELGYSMRPLLVVHQWHDAGHESFIGWGTYWAPLQRLLVGRVFGLPVVPPTSDNRVFSATVADRVGQIGGSPVAEAYHAAGTVGILVVLAAIGVVVGLLDRLPAGGAWDALLGMFGFALLLWVRNDFTPIVLTGLACLALLGAGRALEGVLARRRVPIRLPAPRGSRAAPRRVPDPAPAPGAPPGRTRLRTARL